MAGNFGGRRGQDNKTVLLLGVGAFLFIILMYLVYMLLNAQPQQVETKGTDAPAPKVVQPEQRMVDIVVPLQDIQQGTQLQPSMFKKIQKPESMVDERTVRDFEGIVNMYARTILIANSPVMQDFISNAKPVNPLIIPTGYRAVTIRVNATSSVEGWARAGSKVDVNWITTMRGKRCLTTIVQCAKVVSAERQTQNNTPQGAAVPSTITLVVTAADAKKIQLAELGQGQLSLDLRGDDTACTVDANKGTYCEGEQNEPGKVKKECRDIVIVDGRKWCAAGGRLVPLTEDLDD